MNARLRRLRAAATVGVLAGAVAASAQSGPTTNPYAASPAPAAVRSGTPMSGYPAEISGRIVQSNQARREIVLDNGTRLLVPQGFDEETRWGRLKPGAHVRAEVRQAGEDLVASRIEVSPPEASSTTERAAPAPAGSAASAPGAELGQVAGRVVDSGPVLTLEDGTRLRLPAGSADWRLPPGTYVQAQYRIVNGERVATAVNVLGPTASAPAAPATAPAASTTAPAVVPSASTGQISGRVVQVTPSRAELLLDNGILLTVPSGLPVAWDQLERGAHVTAAYQPVNGRNVVTALQVTSAPR